ncbi:hypothetical protein P5E71_15025 [Clostridium perfringens]|nr:hypothetical protein [Clostridium perfringens]MDK0850264.1 hypothetical protein [Clostridium perfringens]MDM0743547.1 hypothetical protein [Clostridium perfringens]
MLTTKGLQVLNRLESIRTLKIALNLADKADKDNICRITQIELGLILKMNHRSNVSSAIKELESVNFLKKIQDGRSIYYMLNPDFFLNGASYTEIRGKYDSIKTTHRKQDVFNIDECLDEILNDMNKGVGVC